MSQGEAKYGTSSLSCLSLSHWGISCTAERNPRYFLYRLPQTFKDVRRFDVALLSGNKSSPSASGPCRSSRHVHEWQRSFPEHRVHCPGGKSWTQNQHRTNRNLTCFLYSCFCTSSFTELVSVVSVPRSPTFGAPAFEPRRPHPGHTVKGPCWEAAPLTANFQQVMLSRCSASAIHFFSLQFLTDFFFTKELLK